VTRFVYGLHPTPLPLDKTLVSRRELEDQQKAIAELERRREELAVQGDAALVAAKARYDAELQKFAFEQEARIEKVVRRPSKREGG